MRVAIKATVERYIKFVRNRHYGPNSSTSGKMFQVIAKHFQQEINKIYMKVYGGAMTTEAATVNAFNLIPELHQDSKLAIEFLAMRVQHSTVTPERDASPTQLEQARREQQRERQREINGKKLATSTDKAKIEPSAGKPKIKVTDGEDSPICSFNLTEKGCVKADCTRGHREPASEADKEAVKAFFAHPFNRKQKRRA